MSEATGDPSGAGPAMKRFRGVSDDEPDLHDSSEDAAQIDPTLLDERKTVRIREFVTIDSDSGDNAAKRGAGRNNRRGARKRSGTAEDEAPEEDKDVCDDRRLGAKKGTSTEEAAKEDKDASDDHLIYQGSLDDGDEDFEAPPVRIKTKQVCIRASMKGRGVEGSSRLKRRSTARQSSGPKEQERRKQQEG